MEKENKETPYGLINEKIYIIREKKVMLDSDLASLYQVGTMRLNEQVKRNLKRFPADFMFQLSKQEHASLISQFAISNKKGRGGSRSAPYAFTEHGVAMLSAVLRSERAIQMSIFIVRAFVKMRELMAENAELAQKVAEIELQQKRQGDALASVISVVKQLIDPPRPKEPPGFRPSP